MSARRAIRISLAIFYIVVGIPGGMVSFVYAVIAGALSINTEDGLPALGLSVSLVLLGVVGLLLLEGVRLGAAVVAGLAGFAAVGAGACGLWRDFHTGMWAFAVMAAPIALISFAEVRYLRRGRTHAEPSPGADRGA